MEKIASSSNEHTFTVSGTIRGETSEQDIANSLSGLLDDLKFEREISHYELEISELPVPKKAAR